ncbi:adenylate/guanylate cyclase domain-containing protein [Azospirillum halopraeferens]|uniref:adenylate/guanylate cyclase domain-containing protein n=1 Tax=Azospirillum halopraeferens TaxID=34010 RepID=UPI000424A80A|nr:adenylate/guanylate cyclase domain-containing protein [Azospirillum halopraeferens]
MEKPLAILFVDIADSTPLYERIGNVRAAALTRKMLLLLRLAIEANEGTVVKLLGDGLLGAFSTADDAACAAATMMRFQDVLGLTLRIGLHHGPVVQRQEDLYGDACNVAARVEAMARPGEVLATEDFVDRLTPDQRRHARLLNNVAVKGRSMPLRIHRFHPDGPEDPEDALDSTTIGFTMNDLAALTAPDMVLHIDYRGTRLTVGRDRPRLGIGRGEGAGLRIPSRRTSRQHATIDFSRESFILTDQSTNGTFVRAGDSRPVALKRDSTKLVGSGLIGFGAEPADAGEDHVAAFRCDQR